MEKTTLKKGFYTLPQLGLGRNCKILFFRENAKWGDNTVLSFAIYHRNKKDHKTHIWSILEGDASGLALLAKTIRTNTAA